MKRILAVLLTAALLVSAMAISTFAATDIEFSAKGGEVVEKGKVMFKEYCDARKAAADAEEPAVVVEEDTGDNEPVPGV